MKLAETATVYFVVTKDGKMGLLKAFEKSYSVPCEYELGDIFVSPNLLVLKKQGESPETFRLDSAVTNKKVVRK